MSQIILRNMAQVELVDEVKELVLKMYLHTSRAGDTIRNYRYKEGMAYLPPNLRKLKIVASLTDTNIVDERSKGVTPLLYFFKNPDFNFRDYQVKPTQELLNLILQENYGVLHAGCGCGKTVVMTYVAGLLHRKILILVDMGSLLSQWQEAFELVWNRKVQIINRDTEMFSDICITTFQLLHLNQELLLRMRKEFGVLILDEFHTTASDTRREVLMKMDNEYRIGCTATLMKKGFSDEVLTDFVSDSIVKMVDHSALKPTVHFIPTNVKMYSNNPDDWGKITSALSKDLYRNKLIADLVINQAREGRKVLLIGITVDGLKQILMRISKYPECKPKLYVGATSLKQDQELRDQLAKGDINIILTSKKADKGLDLPSLDCLILAKPANNQAFIQQVAGRIVRQLEGKSTPIIYDLVDNSSLATAFARNRSKWYTQLGYTVTKGDDND